MHVAIVRLPAPLDTGTPPFFGRSPVRASGWDIEEVQTVKNELIVLPHDLSDFTDETIDAMVSSAGAGSNSPLLSVEVRHMGGALARKAPGAGALATIDGKVLMFAVGMSMTPEMGAAVKAHVELVQTVLTRWDSGRMYLNFAEKRDRGERFFGDPTYRRLQAVKAAVDPDDVFRSDHPIRLPAAEVRKAA
jgi:FAD/FMN-containing dehydrogenase